MIPIYNVKCECLRNCNCSDTRNLDLPALNIHGILKHIEISFSKHGNFDEIWDFYRKTSYVDMEFSCYGKAWFKREPGETTRYYWAFIKSDSLFNLLFQLKYFCYYKKFKNISLQVISYDYFRELLRNKVYDIGYIDYQCSHVRAGDGVRRDYENDNDYVDPDEG